jgi:hypothetical protein
MDCPNSPGFLPPAVSRFRVQLNPAQCVRNLAVALAVVCLGVSCGKRTEQTPAIAGVETPAAPATPADPAVPSAPIAAVAASPQAALAESDAALKAKDYEKAAVSILAVQQQKRLTDQQAMALRNQMIRLQSSLAAAVASGDPKAKAAAELLRASSH